MSRLLLAAALLPSLALAIPSGKRWFMDPCTSQCTVQGQVSGNLVCTNLRCLPEVRFAASVGNGGGMVLTGQQQVPYSTVLTVMRSAFARWEADQVTSCSTSMRFAYQANFTTPAGTQAIRGNDGNNNVIWLGGTAWRYGNGTLGLTTTSFYPGQLIDADMEMNNNIPWATDGRSSAFDVESVTVHEAGHFIGFDHTTSGNAVMNPSIGQGQVKRSLLGPDLNDVCTVYPGAAGGQGYSCTMASQCTGGRVCEGPASGTTRICTQDCTMTGQSCPPGYTCQNSNNGMACLPQVGVADQCRFCTGGADCSTGICLTDGNGINWCSQSCTPGFEGQCGVGNTCVESSSGTGFCVPTTACTNQCTTANVATNCAPGYGCVNGTCTPTGNTGDRCEVSDFCRSCNACALDENNPNIAFCRACCNNGSPLCTGCTATTCSPVNGEETQCFAISGRQERICFPVSGAQLCQPCGGSVTCLSGNSCFAGSCRATCNPASPGACPACLPQGSSGVCICNPTEIAELNQACGLLPFKVCRNGLTCAGGVCRSPCDIANPASCGPGYTCQLNDGLAVCVLVGGTGGGGGGDPVGGGAGGGDPAGGGSGATGGGAGNGYVCGPGTCSGCCNGNVCVPSTAQTCGLNGIVCRQCFEGELCESGQCVPRSGCGCGSAELAPLLALAVAALTRRRRGRVSR